MKPAVLTEFSEYYLKDCEDCSTQKSKFPK